VLPGLHELFLQGLRPEHCVAVPLDNSPSSTARPSALLPSDVLPPPGPQGRLPRVQPHHDYSWRLQTSLPSGLAPHLGWRTDDYFQGLLWQYIVTFFSGHHGGFSARYFHQLGGYSGDTLGLRRQAFNGHCLGDGASFGFGPCQQKTTGLVTPGGYDYSLRITVFVQCTHLLQYWPLAM
jgi:hypothetical protein